MTKALLNFLATCFVRTQFVPVYFKCRKLLSVLLKEVIISVFNASPRGSCANFLLNNKEISFILKCDQRIHVLGETQKSVQDFIGDVYCPTYPNEKRFYLSTIKISSFYYRKKPEACSHLLKLHHTEQTATKPSFGILWRYYTLFCKKDESRLRKRKTITYIEKISPPNTIKNTQTCATDGKNHSPS